jgi:hypothetical protein
MFKMPRTPRIRNYINEIAESKTVEKLSFFPPFLILVVEIILLYHAFEIQVLYIIELTIILVVLSIIEIFLVMTELHEHYKQMNFDRILTIKLDDFIIDHKFKNVQVVCNKFLEEYPEYSNDRNEVYHIACQILETHKEELWEHNLDKDLHKFIKTTKHTSVDDILKTFIKKYDKYKSDPAKIYQQICEILDSDKKTDDEDK